MTKAAVRKHTGQCFVDLSHKVSRYSGCDVRGGVPALGPLSKYMCRRRCRMMRIMKCKGQLFRGVFGQHPEYCACALELIDPGPVRCEFVDFVCDQALKRPSDVCAHKLFSALNGMVGRT